MVCEVIFSDSDGLICVAAHLHQKTQSTCGFGKCDGHDDGGGRCQSSVDCTAKRVLIDKTEQHLEKSESIQVEVTELEHYLL